MTTDPNLVEALTALIGTTYAECVHGGCDDTWGPVHIAERVASAFERVAWRNDVGSYVDSHWAEMSGFTGTYEGDPELWRPIYRFARPVPVEQDERA